MKNVSILSFHSVLQCISLTLKYWPHFYLSPLNKIPNLSDPPPPPPHLRLCEQPRLKILENLTPPLKCTLFQKSNTHFLKKQDFISNIK